MFGESVRAHMVVTRGWPDSMDFSRDDSDWYCWPPVCTYLYSVIETCSDSQLKKKNVLSGEATAQALSEFIAQMGKCSDGICPVYST